MKSKEPTEIKPFSVYTTDEAASFLRVDKREVYSLIDSQLLVSKNIGKGHKILGENLLRYMGSPSISQMKPDSHLEVPVQVTGPDLTPKYATVQVTGPDNKTIEGKVITETVKQVGYNKV